MSFEQENFSPIGANSSSSPRFWSYKTNDDVAVVSSADYFIRKQFQLSPGDFVYVDSEFGGFARTALIRYDGDGLPSHDFSPSNHNIVLTAGDLTTQNPVAVDTPLQVTFGPAQDNDDASLAADGTITINSPGLYSYVGTFDTGRVGSSGGVSVIVFRGLVNDVQFSTPIVAELDNPSLIVPLQFQVKVRLNAGDTIKIEVARDSSGVNEGGLISTLTSLGWGTSASARTVLTKLSR